ncbi:hypothetical protein LCGC14_0886900 [marine sediment metagenome]|uniref:Leucine-rich repeat domain-containing protein n=1 Tax=marine sediment metagenome TaxID=412755 RepID=A0A0F9RJS3_9ZZZZ
MKEKELTKNDAIVLEKLSSVTSKKYKYIDCFDNDDYRLYHRNDFLYFAIKDKKIVELDIEIDSHKNSVPDCNNLSSLNLLNIYIKDTQEKILNINLRLDSLKCLNLYTEGKVKIKISFENLTNLIQLMIVGDDTGHKEFINIDSIKNAKNLERLEIISIPILKIPEFVKHLDNLKDLVLRNCDLREFDDFILEMESLEWLDLQINKDLRIKKNIRDKLYKKLKLFNPPGQYLDEDLFSLFKREIH